MSTGDLFDPAEGFALRSETIYMPPSTRARLAALETELAGVPPPAAPVKKPFRLSQSDLAKIDRNMARIATFSDPGTAAMFST